MWNIILTVLVFLISFSLLILIHEFGHYWMAKRAGMKVEEFGMGLPPRIFGKKFGETLYSLNWIPFGGFVRIYGEDSGDPKMLRSKRSFAGRPLRQRIYVVIAGVVMNFLLAIVLLSIGFTVGMKPLLTPGGVLPAISDGQIIIENGLVVAEVESGSFAENNGVMVGDSLASFEGGALGSEMVDALLDEEIEDYIGDYGFVRGGEVFVLDKDSSENLGVMFEPNLVLPRVNIHSLPEDDYLKEIGLREKDKVIQVNGVEVFNVDQFERLSFEGVLAGELSYLVSRGGREVVVEDILPKAQSVIISEVIKDSVAEEAGLLSGDIVAFINNKEVGSAENFKELLSSEDPGEKASLLVEREGDMENFTLLPEEGRIGVVISDLSAAAFKSQAKLFLSYEYSSVIEEKELKYSWYQSPFVAASESYEIVKMSARSFFSMIGSVVSGDGVPAGVGGPVKIAYLTHLSLQDGFIEFLRLLGLISLALAALNILPIPALDGGRLLFLMIEAVTGKRVSSKFEMYLHALGFLLLISLIVVITYSDITSLV